MSTFDIAQGSLLGTAVLQGITAIAGDPEKTKTNTIGATVCLVAYQHYNWMRSSNDRLALRYSDWFLTLPLLLWECALISGSDTTSPLFICSMMFIVLMLIAGKLSDKYTKYKQVLLLCGMCMLVLAGIFFFLSIPSFDSVLTIISILSICSWSFYGVVALKNGPEWTYNILDILNKSLFGILVVAFATK
jgi:bacteriorhodopsin